MSRNKGQVRLLPMETEAKQKHLMTVHETVESISGVAKGFGRNPVHVIGADGRKRAFCDLYVVFDDGTVLEQEGVPTSPSSIRRAVEGFRRMGATRKPKRQILPPDKDPKEVAERILVSINPDYRIESYLAIGVNRYQRYGNEYETPYCYHDLLQVSHPELGLSPFVELETLIRYDPPRDPFTELREIIEAHRIVHETYQEGVVACGFSLEKGRSSVQVMVPGESRKNKLKFTRLMQSVRAHARERRGHSRRMPFRSPHCAGGFLVALLDVDLPGIGTALKICLTSRSHREIYKSVLARGYNFHVRGVLRHVTFDDEETARKFDQEILDATVRWKIEVGQEIQGSTEFRDYYQLTPIDEIFRATQKTYPKGRFSTPAEHKAVEQPKQPKRTTPVRTTEVSLEEAFGDEVVRCLVCGEAFQALARHVRTAHGLAPAAYREKFNIPKEVPLTSKRYSGLRRAIATKRE